MFKIWIVLICYFMPIESYAYLDPGSGSVALQILLGFLLAATYSIKLYWSKVTEFFSRLLGRSKDRKDE